MNDWLKDMLWAIALGIPLGYIFFTYGGKAFIGASALIIFAGLAYFFLVLKRR